ncbi:FMN-binding protein [candidate division KSB1 bacterium]|nr:FMN-binding protein [candidate division KSB1 bacterium]
MNRSVSTVLFMMVITIVFIAMLAFLNGVMQSRIQTNLQIQESKSILYAFGILPEGVDESTLSGTVTTSDLPWNETTLLKTIHSELSPIAIPITAEAKNWLSGSMLTPGDTLTVYVRNAQKEPVQAFGFYLRGKGLWGTIQAFIAVNPDFTRAIGIDFTDQVETPGLGARIAEQEFKHYFRNLDIDSVCRSSESDLKMVRKKSDPNTMKVTSELQAVTGATQTCNGVMNMLRTDLKFYFNLIQANPHLFATKN